MKDKIELFSEKKSCCSCGACLNICPVDAISMQVWDGFQYPAIDYKKCVACGNCLRSCNFQHDQSIYYADGKVYAAAHKDVGVKKNSSSGGIFFSLAQQVLAQGGVVFGCEMVKENGVFIVRHIGIEKIEDICKIQGSKYVQSDVGDTYCQVLEHLRNGRMVLFSGTPCQVDGLTGFLGNRKYDNLYTVDIICHGVPGIQFFNDAIRKLEKKIRASITGISFRDKELGWGLKARISYEKNGKKRYALLSPNMFSYYRMFLDGTIYRENCYSCKYARKERVGDITLGDYWGVEVIQPDILKENGGIIDGGQGVSLIIANTREGEKLLRVCGETMYLIESSLDKVSLQNQQLKNPVERKPEVDMVRQLYLESYDKVELYHTKKMGIKQFFYEVYIRMPERWQIILRKGKKIF